MSLLIVGMDVTIVNVALPAIRHDFGASVSALQWTTAAYTVVLASLLMLGGSTADRLGRARVFKIGLALFTAASLACALAPGVGWLIAFRVLQGAAGAMLNPVAMSIIRNTFEDPRERAQAIGIWAAVVGISLALGPVLGGLLVGLSWRAVFLVNIPIGLAAIALTARFVPESRAPRPRRPDPVGQVLVIVMLASLTSAIIEGPSLGWRSPWIVALVITAGVSLATFVRYELRRGDPLIEPRFFASRPFSAATVIAVAAFTAFGGFLFLNTLYLQDVRGLSAASAGLYTLPIAAMTVLCGPIAGRVVGTRGVRGPLVVGGLGLGLGGLMLVALSADTSLGWLLGAYCVFGLGFGAVNPPITNTAVSGMPPSQAGVAAAVATTSRQVGLTLGVAIVGAIVTAGVGGSLHDDLVAATHAAWWLIAALGAGIVALGIVASTAGGPGERRPDRRAAGRRARGGVMAAPTRISPRRAWRAMSGLVLDHDRKEAVSRELGLSFARVRALRRLAAEPLTLRALAELLVADPPYVTLIVDDLEKRGLAHAHPAPRGPAREARGADRRRPGGRRARRGDPRRATGRAARRARGGPRGAAARARGPRALTERCASRRDCCQGRSGGRSRGPRRVRIRR